jgi:hypothetical protein
MLKTPLWCSSFGLNYCTTLDSFSPHLTLFFLLHLSISHFPFFHFQNSTLREGYDIDISPTFTTDGLRDVTTWLVSARELVEQGYKGSYASVRETILRFLPEGRKTPSDSQSGKQAPVLSRQATFLFLRQPEKLEADEQETLRQLLQLDPEVNLAYELVQQFTQMLRTRTGEKLDDWLEKVRASQLRELQSFVVGIERDPRSGYGGTDASPKQRIGRRKSQQAETHQADDVRESRISAVTSACSSCTVRGENLSNEQVSPLFQNLSSPKVCKIDGILTFTQQFACGG